MYKPISVKALDDYKIMVKYEDGVEGVVSLAHLLGKDVFKAWEDYENFEKVTIDPESHAISWGKELDICPDAVYFEIKNINPEKYFNQPERSVINA